MALGGRVVAINLRKEGEQDAGGLEEALAGVAGLCEKLQPSVVFLQEFPHSEGKLAAALPGMPGRWQPWRAFKNKGTPIVVYDSDVFTGQAAPLRYLGKDETRTGMVEEDEFARMYTAVLLTTRAKPHQRLVVVNVRVNGAGVGEERSRQLASDFIKLVGLTAERLRTPAVIGGDWHGALEETQAGPQAPADCPLLRTTSGFEAHESKCQKHNQAPIDYFCSLWAEPQTSDTEAPSLLVVTNVRAYAHVRQPADPVHEHVSCEFLLVDPSTVFGELPSGKTGTDEVPEQELRLLTTPQLTAALERMGRRGPLQAARNHRLLLVKLLLKRPGVQYRHLPDAARRHLSCLQWQGGPVPVAQTKWKRFWHSLRSTSRAGMSQPAERQEKRAKLADKPSECHGGRSTPAAAPHVPPTGLAAASSAATSPAPAPTGRDGCSNGGAPPASAFAAAAGEEPISRNGSALLPSAFAAAAAEEAISRNSSALPVPPAAEEDGGEAAGRDGAAQFPAVARTKSLAAASSGLPEPAAAEEDEEEAAGSHGAALPSPAVARAESLPPTGADLPVPAAAEEEEADDVDAAAEAGGEEAVAGGEAAAAGEAEVDQAEEAIGEEAAAEEAGEEVAGSAVLPASAAAEEAGGDEEVAAVAAGEAEPSSDGAALPVPAAVEAGAEAPVAEETGEEAAAEAGGEEAVAAASAAALPVPVAADSACREISSPTAVLAIAPVQPCADSQQAAESDGEAVLAFEPVAAERQPDSSSEPSLVAPEAAASPASTGAEEEGGLPEEEPGSASPPISPAVEAAEADDEVAASDRALPSPVAAVAEVEEADWCSPFSPVASSPSAGPAGASEPSTPPTDAAHGTGEAAQEASHEEEKEEKEEGEEAGGHPKLPVSVLLRQCLSNPPSQPATPELQATLSREISIAQHQLEELLQLAGLLGVGAPLAAAGAGQQRSASLPNAPAAGGGQPAAAAGKADGQEVALRGPFHPPHAPVVFAAGGSLPLLQIARSASSSTPAARAKRQLLAERIHSHPLEFESE